MQIALKCIRACIQMYQGNKCITYSFINFIVSHGGYRRVYYKKNLIFICIKKTKTETRFFIRNPSNSHYLRVAMI